MKESELGKVYADGECIFKEGEEGTRMYVVQSGKVKITKKTPTEDITIAILDEGEIFGEMAIFDRQPRSATVTALHKARILSIDKTKLFQMVERDPTLVFKMIESMSQRIRRLTDEFAALKKNKVDILNIFTDIEEICKFILEDTRNIISADNGSIMLIENEDDEVNLTIKAAFGTEWDPKVRFSIGEGVAGDVLKTGKAELINNVSMDHRFKTGTPDIKSVICVPLKWQGSVFGVINMSRISDKLFSVNELKILSALASQISVAIENVRIFTQFKNVAEECLRHAVLLYI
jgi:CRP-like cAMP-binding protein